MDSTSEAIELLENIKTYDNLWIKVGLRLFIREGHFIFDKIKAINPNFKIFLDLKLYDIPNTMADSAYEIAKLNIDMFNIHLSCGREAIKEVVSRLKYAPNQPLLLGVSALTSFEQNGFNDIYKQNINDCVESWSYLGYKNGIDGVVCSAYESKMVKEKTNENFITLTPAIRLEPNTKDDQNRVATIEFAKENKSDFIVIGRPIYQSSNPSLVVKEVLGRL